MAFPKRIYLTGFMAAGKSTVGFIVANTIGYGFLDLDDLISTIDGRSIPEIFRESGEKLFRELESKALAQTATLERKVIALGGGALLSESAWSSLPADAVVVYLDTAPNILARRIYYGRTSRPLMQNADGSRASLGVVERRVTEMLAERRPSYERAHVTITSGDRSIGKTVDALVAALRHYEPRNV